MAPGFAAACAATISGTVLDGELFSRITAVLADSSLPSDNVFVRKATVCILV
jgi:hypothetical protein